MAKGLYDLQLKTMHRFERLFCDETPMPVLDPGRGRTKICQFWAHAVDDRPWKGPAPPAVAYVFAGGRGKKEIVSQLAGFEGVLQVDGYAAYASLAGDAKMSGKIRLAYCLVHARRNFVKVHKTTNSPFAREVIERIGAVYAIEERIRGLDSDERRAVRQAETKPLMEALKARLEAVKDGISRQSTLIKAIDYMLERWEGLTAFLNDGRLEPDTNTVERSIRSIAIGKKNSLFSGDEGGGETWAILSSLLNTARLNGVDPEAYLVDVLERRHEDQPASRTSGLELEGRARGRKTRCCMTPSKQRRGTRGARKPAKTTMADYAMSFERLGQWMSERARSPTLRHPQATSLSMLDGAVTAVVVGPLSMAPEEWVCPLLGVDSDAFNHDTEEFSAIAATLIRHNAISEALSTRPESFEPAIVGRRSRRPALVHGLLRRHEASAYRLVAAHLTGQDRIPSALANPVPLRR
jgi:hypothetical protein